MDGEQEVTCEGGKREMAEAAARAMLEQSEFGKVKLLVALPSLDTWCAETGMCIALMVHALTLNVVPFHLWNVRSSILPRSRQDLTDMAREQHATHMLFIDSDQTFPEVLPLEWLRADRPVIAANIATKGMPSYPTAKKLVGGIRVNHYSDTASERFTKVDKVGTGIMMIRGDVLQQLPRPCYLPTWNAELRDGVGDYEFEDWALMAHFNELGIPVVVDNEMSLHIGHIGKHVYTHAGIIATRQRENEDGSRQGRDSQPRIIAAR